MGLSEADVSKQIKHMLAFIEQEANEKVEEIEAKAEEEFNIEKGKLVQQQRVKIMDYYAKKEKAVELQRKIQNSNLTSQSKLTILKAKENHMQKVLSESHDQLKQLTQDQNYRDVLQGLIMQSLFELKEPEVIVYCKKEDVGNVKNIIDECKEVYQKAANQNINISLDMNNYLPNDSLGGVIVLNKTGKIKVTNSLDSRLEWAYKQMVPEVKETLFGLNKNRKFYD